MSRDEPGNEVEGEEENLTPEERLVEVFLPEALGWGGPPDLATRAVSLARARERMRWWRGGAMAALVFLGVAVGFWKLRGWREGSEQSRQVASREREEPLMIGPVAAGVGEPARATSGPYRPAVAAAIKAEGAAPMVLRGTAGEPGCIYGTEDADGTVVFGGNVKMIVTPWSTVIYRGADEQRGQKFELADGIVTFVIPAGSAGRAEVTTQDGACAFDSGGPGGKGAVTQFRIVGKYYLGPPEGTLVLSNEGVVHMSGWWGKKDLVPPGVVLGLFKDAGVANESMLRRRLYPRVQPVPEKGEFVQEGPMSIGPSGWTIRNQAGVAYVVLKEPEVVSLGGDDWRLSPRFKAGWIYRVTWVDGVWKDAVITREPAVLYR